MRALRETIQGQRTLHAALDRLCEQHAFGMSCEKHAFGMTCEKHAFGMTCEQHAFGMTCEKHAFGMTCEKHAFGMTPQLRLAMTGGGMRLLGDQHQLRFPYPTRLHVNAHGQHRAIGR